MGGPQDHSGQEKVVYAALVHLRNRKSKKTIIQNLVLSTKKEQVLAIGHALPEEKKKVCSLFVLETQEQIRHHFRGDLKIKHN